MTIHEIQSSLDELRKRHPGLNEDLLGVLLGAGGWEEKEITEAKLLFRSQEPGGSLPHTDEVLLKGPEELLIEEPHKEEPSTQDIQKQLREDIAVLPKEKESLVTPEATVVDHSLPDDLPLRPFASSPHVWSFSNYKNVFHGGEEEKKTEPPQKAIVITEEQPAPIAQTPPVVVAEKVVPPPQIPKEIEVSKVPLTKKDESIIVFLAALSLAVVLLLLYMYNNNRL